MKTGLLSAYNLIQVLPALRCLPAFATVLIACLAVFPLRAAAQVFDDFETYAVGSNLHGQGGWAGWAGNPNAGAQVSSNFSFSPTRSVITAGPTDVVRSITGATNGPWVFRVMQYIPFNASGTNYTLLLNKYQPPFGSNDLNWSVQFQANLALGQIISDLGGGASLPLVKDQWVELRCEINLALNSVSEFYNGQPLSTHAWRNGEGLSQIQALDFFANNSGPVYYDNVSLQPGPGPSPPVITSIHALANNGTTSSAIGVRFDQPVTLPSATSPSNYLVNAGTVSVADVHLHPDGRSVDVVTAAPVGEFFSVCAANVQGTAGNSALTIATGYTSEYSGVTIGTPGDPGAAGQVSTAFWDSFDSTSGGSGFGEFADDHFHFIQQLMSGDFDVRVQVTSLEMADPSSSAGLMARESLAATGVSIQTFLTPTGGLNQILATVRPVAGSDAFNFLAGQPVTADAKKWLRLTRSNDVFAAYYATNGDAWVVSGVTTQAFATNLFVGMAVSAHSIVTNTTASFTDFYAQGRRPGDEILPALTASLSGTNISFSWPQTPRSYALEVSSNLTEWGLLVIPVGFDGSKRVFQAGLPVGLLGQKLFLRNTRVDKLIPDIPSIMTTAGIILSPGAGLTASATPGTLCSASLLPGTAFAQTGSYVAFTNATPLSSVDTLQSSTSLNTVMQVRNVTTNAIGVTKCNDDKSTSETRSEVIPLPGSSYPSYTKFTFSAAARSGSPCTTVTRVYLTP